MVDWHCVVAPTAFSRHALLYIVCVWLREGWFLLDAAGYTLHLPFPIEARNKERTNRPPLHYSPSYTFIRLKLASSPFKRMSRLLMIFPRTGARWVYSPAQFMEAFIRLVPFQSLLFLEDAPVYHAPFCRTSFM